MATKSVKKIQRNTSAGKNPKGGKSAKTSKGQKNQPQKKTQGVESGGGFINTAVQFLREVKTELKKVTWPTKKQTVSSTIVVVTLVIIVAFYLGLVDLLLSHVVGYVMQG